MTATHPNGYATQLVTLEVVRQIHAAKMIPEFERRLFAWLKQHPNIGIGGGWRSTQPAKPGFAPDGKSFHQSQTFASGTIGYCAVDLVVAVPGKVHRAPSWAETADAPTFGLHTFIKVPPEPWHMQPLEIRGWQSWVDAGRRDPIKFALPGDVPPQEVDVLVKVKTPPSGSPPWWPWIGLFDSGVARPLLTDDLGPPTGGTQQVTDVGQYRRLAASSGVDLSTEFP